MKTIVIDDDLRMLDAFERIGAGIEGLELVGKFEDAFKALDYACQNRVDLAFLDVLMPGMSGIELASKLRSVRKDILIVFISGYNEYIHESNRVGADYYIMKPYDRETLEMVMDRLRLIAHRQKKDLYIQMLGRFTLLRGGVPVPLRGKAKEILALIATRRGKEISNEEIFYTLWENRTYSNDNMTVYYNALRRLKASLEAEGLSSLLLSTARGQIINTELFDCDYYTWLDENRNNPREFNEEFLSEYSWGEYILGSILYRDE